MDGAESQLQSHFGIALNTGLTEAQLRDLITYLRTCVGPDQSGRAAAILDQVLAAGRRVH